MKITIQNFFLTLALLSGIYPAAAQDTRFFRIAGPAPTTITAFRPDGSMVWSNTEPGTNYIVQSALSLSEGTNWTDYVQLPVANRVNTNQLVDFNPPDGMVFIPAGIFTMGDVLDNESDAKPTNTIVSAFYLDANLVSYSQWQPVYNWATNNGYSFANAGSGRDTNQPVQTIDWYDAIKWCNARSQMAGWTPVYYVDAAFTQIFTNGESIPFANWTNNGYRLPTEAEWEKAARGGLIGQRFPWGDTISETQANYYGNTVLDSYDSGPNDYNAAFSSGGFPYTSPIGYFPPNGYGLYDMAGNVFEWCWDWYGMPYAGGTDPHGADLETYRVLRGGAWNGYAGNSRCSGRAGDYPFAANGYYGFRCAETIK